MQKSNACPYYRGGYCISPLLDQPTDSVTSTNRCLNNYFTCQFYPDKDKNLGNNEIGLTRYTAEEENGNRQVSISFYIRVNALKEKPEIECPQARIIKTDKGYLIGCAILNRILTISQVNLCVSNWHKCPFKVL